MSAVLFGPLCGGEARLEFGASDPNPMQDDSEFAGERDLGAFGPPPGGHAHGPGLERKPALNTGHDDVRRLEERDTGGGITHLGDRTCPIGFARLVASA